MRMKEPIGPAHPRWVGGGHDGKKDLTTAGHGRWCRAVQPPSASDLPPPASCGVCRDGGQIAQLGVAAGWSVNRRQLVGSCQASWRRHPSDAGKISCIPPNISGQDRQAADSGVSTDQKIAERIVFQTTTAAVLHKGFACEEQRRLGDVQHAQFHAIEHLVQRFDGRKGQRQLGINDGIDDQPVHLGLGLQLCDGPVGPIRVVFQDINQNVGVDQHQATFPASSRSNAIRSCVRHLTSALPRAASNRSGLRLAEPLALWITTSPSWLTAKSTGMPGCRPRGHWGHVGQKK